MYEIALSVGACVRSKTRVDIAWMISPSSSNEALALTPGAGRIGTLFDGAFDGSLADVASRKFSQGRRVAQTIGAFESSITGMAQGSDVEFVVVPAEQFPDWTWGALLERQSLAIVCTLDGIDVTGVEVFNAGSIVAAPQEVADLFSQGVSASKVAHDLIITIIHPVTKCVITGSGPIAEAIATVAETLGWKPVMETRGDIVSGLIAGLSHLDVVIIMGHDVESSSRNLASALESDAGYIGALGSRKMQEDRADWLAYREVTDLSRVHGPAGLDISAKTPAEIAISVAAQAISVLKAT